MILLGIEFLIICALGYGIKKIFIDSYTRTNYLLTYEPNNYINNNNNDDYNINYEVPPKYDNSNSILSPPLYE